jgi:hypothetical protein
MVDDLPYEYRVISSVPARDLDEVIYEQELEKWRPVQITPDRVGATCTYEYVCVFRRLRQIELPSPFEVLELDTCATLRETETTFKTGGASMPIKKTGSVGKRKTTAAKSTRGVTAKKVTPKAKAMKKK